MTAFDHPGVPQHVFLGLIWASETLALLFLSIRLFVRVVHAEARFFLDDALVVFAAILTVVVAALWQWQAPAMYEILDVEAGLAAPGVDFIAKTELWLKVQLISELFFYTSLTSVKLAFLLFFRRLGANVHHFSLLWWPIVALVGILYIICIGTVEYRCLLPKLEDITGYCSSKTSGDFTVITLKFNCAMDVLSDFLIILIPICLLWNVHIALSKKIALIGLFSLSLVTMAIATARAADLAATSWTNNVVDPSYLWMWTAIEPCIAIAVSCLSAFPQLFTASTNANKRVYKPTDSYMRMMSRIRSRRNLKQSNEHTLYDLSAAASDQYTNIEGTGTSSTEYLDPVLPPGSKVQQVYYKASFKESV
ncbi:hypothetical protein BD289DRAFT_399406 [Coniella lustricola]|uniref:Rhodopsin domain-containing protein n=1 Tax=Coniella lustricola TaxID=2025994 RepID=A0A2T2ZSP6_9PEZI|nr:hypothetical protein BD289DRAFT_399406 [Coniella lustricola]